MADTMSSGDYWAEFPLTYRAEQIAVIMRWVRAGESGVVVGGSGSGKSNLLGFLSSRPEAVRPYLADAPTQYYFLRLDINSLPALTTPYFYRGLIQTLAEAAAELGENIQQPMEQMLQGRVDWADTFQALTILRKAHRLVIQPAGKKVIWLLDRFDEACRRLDVQTLSSLRSLRDQFKGQLCYVVAARHPLARLRDPHEIDEFYELVAANLCWVGPMVERDARWVADQMAARLRVTFDEVEVSQLLAVTGGLPAFIKLACLALAEGAVSKAESTPTWAEKLLARSEFQRNCQEIWNDLSAGEQAALTALSAGADERLLDPDAIIYLEQTGLLARSAQGKKASLFSPILARFIGQQRERRPGMLELHPKTRAVLRGGLPLGVELTAHEDRLLSFFLEHPGEICDKDVLIQAVWPGEVVFEGISDDRLTQLVRRLREKIELDATGPTYIQTVRGRGYRFAQPGEK